MNSIKRFKNLLGILMLYAANIIVPDDRPVIIETTAEDKQKKLTAKKILRLSTSER